MEDSKYVFARDLGANVSFKMCKHSAKSSTNRQVKLSEYVKILDI